ncbi:MAG: sn-glycerol-1-phosphate dehydrogenase [Spirochaetaceae bacterium]
MNLIHIYKDFADSTKYLFVCNNLYANMLTNFKDFISDRSIFIINDENTKVAAGNEFIEFCKKNSIKVNSEYTFKNIPELDASYKNVEILKESLSKTDSIPIAIGSGTINDLVKRASFELNRKYGIIATAASVDGYASDGAAILYNGLKQTMPCPAPEFIAADPKVLIDAPIESSSSGYADLLAKNPAGADWILADIVGLDKINRSAWNLIQKDLLKWTTNPERLAQKDEVIISDLMTGLTVSGFAMQLMKRSRPVSGAEHLMSHVWEMENLMFNNKHVSHGFKVAIGSLSSVALMETILNINIYDFDIDSVIKNWPTWDVRKQEIIDDFSDLNDIENLLTINKEKYIKKDQLYKRLLDIVNNWEHIKFEVNKHLLPYKELKYRLFKAGCPTLPQDIGLTKSHILRTYKKAGMLRNRYTILDFVYEMGLMDNCLESISKSDIYLN